MHRHFIAWAVGLFCVGQASAAFVVDRYQLNEASGSVAHDPTGANNGTLSGNAAFVTGGINGGNALSVNNATGTGLVNLGTFFHPTGDFSVAAWVKTTQTGGEFAVANNQSSSDNGFGLGVGNIDPAVTGWGAPGQAVFEASQHPTLGDHAATSTTLVNDGNWHQIVGIYQAGGLNEVAVDGTIQGTVLSRAYVDPNNFLVIGGADTSGNAATGSFTGLVDDVQIYNGALTGAQVQQLFQNPGTAITPEPSSALLVAMAAGLFAFRRNRRIV